MYRPPAFAEDDPVVLVALARLAGFGHLVTVGDEGSLTSTPVPFLVDDDGASVRMHVARANPTWRTAPCAAMLIVPVTDAYISPSWYPTKAEHGKVVPTWNYEVVHAHGALAAHDDADWVHRQITDLTDANESALPAPWSVADPPDGYVQHLQRGIVGLELVVDRLEGKRKLGQNRSDTDGAGVIAALEIRGDARSVRLAASMRDRRPR